jgi:hypothetical protein
MPLKNMLANIAFDPETAEVLSVAFEEAWQSLKAAGDPLTAESRAEETRALLAKRIIELAQRGERDAGRLREEAIARVRSTDMNR